MSADPAAQPHQDTGRCGCASYCGDDGDTEGPGVCKGLPRPPAPPLVEVILVPRSAALSPSEDTPDG
jgi:hypothetical protein